MFKATDASTGGGSRKILTPGTHYCHIVDLRLETPPYDKNNRQVQLVLEGVDQGDDFEGIAVNKDKPKLGNYRGMIATVKHDYYDFKDFEWKGETIEKDQQIYNWINNLARKMGVLEKMNADNVSGESIEDYVDAAKEYIANPDIWGHFTIAGKEYYTEGYEKPNYRLFLASKSILDKTEKHIYKNRNAFIFGGEDESHAECIENISFINFDESKHIIKAAAPETPKEVDGFSANGQASDKVETDLDL